MVLVLLASLSCFIVGRYFGVEATNSVTTVQTARQVECITAILFLDMEERAKLKAEDIAYGCNLDPGRVAEVTRRLKERL